MNRKTWDDFRNSGLLWFINSILHLFGWAIVVNIDNNKVVEAYPARVSFRGFDVSVNDKGYQNITRYLKENIDQLMEEVNE